MQLGPTDPSSIQIPDDQTASQSGTVVESQDSSPVAFERLTDRLKSSDSLPAILFTAGILLMVVILMRKLLRSTKANRKRSNSLPSPQKRITQINNQAHASMDISTSVMVETEEMARRLGAVMDNKAARLELLIEEADRKLAQLNQSLVNTAITPSTTPTPPTPLPDPHARALDPSLLDRARLEQDIEDRQSRVAGRIDHNAPTPIQSPEFVPEPKPVPQQTPQQTTQSRVLELADEGCTNIEIAHQLNQPIGQVELILNLRKQQG